MTLASVSARYGASISATSVAPASFSACVLSSASAGGAQASHPSRIASRIPSSTYVAGEITEIHSIHVGSTSTG